MLPKQWRALGRVFWRGRSAGPIVEFALVVPMLLMLVMGVVDFGRFYFVKNSLVSAVREGARLGAVQLLPCSQSSQITIRTTVKARFSSMGGSTLDDGQILISCLPAGAPIETVNVSVVGYTVNFLTPLYGMLGVAKLKNLGASAVFRWELSS